MKSDVYFVKIDASDSGARIRALKELLTAINPFSGYQNREFIPVKITIGESGCNYNLAPQLLRPILSAIKEKGAKPFLFDTSVIYHGQRQNAVDYLTLAQNKGFSYSKVGAPFIIADGLFGQDGKEFALAGPNIKKIKVPAFVGMLDSLVTVSHVTGHILSAYAGAIKNVAMGMSCRPTKQVQHSSLKPHILKDKCTACGCCIEICPVKAISFKDSKAFIDPGLCVGCGECLCACKFDAVFLNWKEDNAIFCKRMVEVANFVLSKFKNKLFFNFALDITKECDCMSTKDEEMICADLGIFASSDILSLDKATADLASKDGQSNFLAAKKDSYEAMFRYAQDTGMGNLEYNLIKI